MKTAAKLAVKLKTPGQIDQMRRAGRIVRLVLDRIGGMVAPGVTTTALNAEAERLCVDEGATCLFKGVPGRGKAPPFPGAICASINEEVVHGVPSDRALAEGDIISVDFGARLDGWCGDAAETFAVGEPDGPARRLMDVTRHALEIAVEMIRPGERWSAVAGAMQEYVESNGFSVVREFVGHGIGKAMHEDPKVPNFVSRELLANDIVLEEGMTLAVEPMVNLGSDDVQCAPDGWTIRTKDRRPSAHFEHTIAVRPGGADVLTS